MKDSDVHVFTLIKMAVFTRYLVVDASISAFYFWLKCDQSCEFWFVKKLDQSCEIFFFKKIPLQKMFTRDAE